MTREQILSHLTTLFRDVFQDSTIQIHDHTTAGDIPGWDSISHIDMVVQVEARFRIRLTTREVAELKNVGDLVRLICAKQQTA